MREIKFRAWGKVRKGFINGFNMIGYSTGQGSPSKKLNRFSTEWKDEDIVLMQFTGLKDKNGKDIYEGDIVDFRHGERRLYITFNYGQWNMCGNNPEKDYRNLDHYINHDGPIVVIGNIFQNLELMGGELIAD